MTMFKCLVSLAGVLLIAVSGFTAFAEPKGGTSGLAQENEQRIDDIENLTPGGVKNCFNGEIAKYLNGMWECAADTNAQTECGSGEALLGDGTCEAIPAQGSIAGYEVVENDVTLEIGTTGSDASVECPEGKVALSGGVISGQRGAMTTNTSGPLLLGEFATGWHVFVTKLTTGFDLDFTVRVICAFASS
jgi:hypothetical protein